MRYSLSKANELQVDRHFGIRPTSHPHRVRGNEMSTVLGSHGLRLTGQLYRRNGFKM